MKIKLKFMNAGKYFTLFIWMMLIGISGYTQNMDSEKLRNTCMSGAVLIKTPSGLGSGFLVNTEGYILTNHHVINGFTYSPNVIKVYFENGEQYNVLRVIDYIPQDAQDMAILKISPVSGHQVLPFLPDGDVNQAVEVAAIGNPLGLDFSFNKGLISNLNPDFNKPYLLQTDVLVNPGNSGGPLLNKNGQVVGMIVSGIRNNIATGINFAIKASVLRDFLKKSDIGYQTQTLIGDNDLKTTTQRELSTEEKEAMKNAGLAKIEALKNSELTKIEQANQLAIQKTALQKELEMKKAIKAQQDLEDQQVREKIQLEKDKMRLEQDKKNAIDQRKKQRMSLPGRISFKIGGGTQYYQSDIADNQNSGTGTLQNETPSLYPVFNSMLAYRLGIQRTRRGGSRSNSLGLFVDYGFLSKNTALQLIQSNQLKNNTSQLKNFNPFIELEAGILVKEWCRLSGGIGSQTIENNQESSTLSYYTTTVGFVFRIKWVDIDLNGTGLLGGFYVQPAFRANLTLNIHLKFGKW